ncbi:MAG: alkaline phosphatase family protein [Chloroflexi bacterium]|nr:alkaline phosphatase family protein [Chloroflexota bacterium]
MQRSSLSPCAGLTGRLTLIVVWDGLRPDFVSPEVTPVLYARASHGVWFEASHCAYPSETRVNATALATGCYPGRSGITGNSIYVPGFDPAAPWQVVNTGDHQQLARVAEIDAPLQRVPSFADTVAAAGGLTVVASSGSPGSALLQNPRPDGITVNYAFVRPEPVADEVRHRFGVAPPDSFPATGRSDWVTRVLREYLLPEVVSPVIERGLPAAVIWWNTDPDHTAHRLALGSAETVRSLRENDRRLAAVLDTIGALNLGSVTDVLLTSDHGFSTPDGGGGFSRGALDAMLGDGLQPGDIVNAGGALYLQEPAQRRAAQIVSWLQRQPWLGTLLTHDGGPAAGQPGTLPLSLAWNGRVGARAPDIRFSPRWTSAPNAAGVPGTVIGSGRSAASHGSASPYDMRNSLFAWGPQFKRGVRSAAPAGIVDVAPTVCHLLGLRSLDCDGRVLEEALVDGPDPDDVVVKREVRQASSEWPGGHFRQELRLARIGNTAYLQGGYSAECGVDLTAETQSKAQRNAENQLYT